MSGNIQCRSWEEAEVHLACLYARQDALADRVRLMEKQLDTLGTVWYRRLWFRVQGWPPWYIVARRPHWRPWHRYLPPR